MIATWSIKTAIAIVVFTVALHCAGERAQWSGWLDIFCGGAAQPGPLSQSLSSSSRHMRILRGCLRLIIPSTSVAIDVDSAVTRITGRRFMHLFPLARRTQSLNSCIRHRVRKVRATRSSLVHLGQSRGAVLGWHDHHRPKRQWIHCKSGSLSVTA